MRPTPVSDDFSLLSSELSLPDFDFLLVGDGSGTILANPCAWACFSYEKTSQTIHAHHGCSNHGTNNFAELAPYLFALHHIHSQFSSQDQLSPTRNTRVVIVSDSELTVRCGNKTYSRNSNQAWWVALDWFASHGYSVEFYHTKRNSNAIGTAADALAGDTRKNLMRMEQQPDDGPHQSNGR